MHFICPECKNSIDTSSYHTFQKDQVVECPMCGISLLVLDIQKDSAIVEVTDEGK